jgi:exonuclease SbcC
LKDFDENKIFADYDEFQEVKELKLKKENELKILTSQIESLEIKLVELEKYKYDPDCEYCLKNGEHQITHKTEIMESLNQKGDEILYTKSKYELIEIDYERLSEAENQKQKYDSLSDDLKQIESDAYKTHAKIKEMEKDILNTEGILSNLYDDKQRYEKNKSAIEHNKKMDVEIKSIEGEIQLQISLKNKLIKELDKINSQILINETNKKNLEEEVKDLVEAEQKVNDYELYLRLVSRDGIPQLIINDALPIIESEVNVVLERMMAGFKIGITNEDKNINLYIRYDDQEWPLNLSSGMERFVTSLALRVGLINVSNLPSPNFLVIDEGFGSLDSENLSNMQGAFDYLKTRFESVFIISHLDTIKDFMDHLLPITIKKGYSNIVYS